MVWRFRMLNGLLAFLLCMFLFILNAQIAHGAYLYFPSAVKDATAANAGNLLGPPDGDHTLFGDGATAVFYQFNAVVSTDTAAFAAALGVSEDIIGRADFFAFDWNNGGNGFETSTWRFTDGVNSALVSHTYSDAASGAIISNADMSLPDFNTIFGTRYPTFPADDVGFLLFDLNGTAIDLSSPNFEVQITGGTGNLNYNAPDIIGIGRSAVPIPGAAWLLGTGLFGLMAIRKNKQDWAS